MRKAIASRRLATATHEAGHAVALLAFGLPVTSISIRRRRDANGEVRHPGIRMIEGSSTRAACVRVAKQLGVVAYAGLAAERLVTPQAPDYAGAADDDDALQVLRDEGVLPPRASGGMWLDLWPRLRASLQRDAAILVRRKDIHRAIDTLAAELLRRISMSGADAEACLAACSCLPPVRRTVR